jgi:hypothetical protein
MGKTGASGKVTLADASFFINRSRARENFRAAITEAPPCPFPP